MVPLRTRDLVDEASLDTMSYDTFKHRHALSDQVCVFLFSTEAGAYGAMAYSRMFAPSVGISEDPATGSASGPLGCYLVRHVVVSPENATALLSRQGVKMVGILESRNLGIWESGNLGI
jgi:trans-2,3-dihydro-3-hydroxyanthranilate isomerase